MAKLTPDRRWAKEQAKEIERQMQASWGKHASAILHRDVLQALFESRVLYLILGQAMEEYAPAQQMIQQVMRESRYVNKEGETT